MVLTRPFCRPTVIDPLTFIAKWTLLFCFEFSIADNYFLDSINRIIYNAYTFRIQQIIIANLQNREFFMLTGCDNGA